MRLACFSSALLTMVHKHQAAAVHLEDTRKPEPSPYSPNWFAQEDSDTGDWKQLVQRGIEAATQEAAQLTTESSSAGEVNSSSLIQLFEDGLARKQDIAAQIDSDTHAENENIDEYLNKTENCKNQAIKDSKMATTKRGKNHPAKPVTTNVASLVTTPPNSSEHGTGVQSTHETIKETTVSKTAVTAVVTHA